MGNEIATLQLHERLDAIIARLDTIETKLDKLASDDDDQPEGVDE